MMPEDDEMADWPRPSLRQLGLLAVPLLAIYALVGAAILLSWLIREIASLFTGKDEHAR